MIEIARPIICFLHLYVVQFKQHNTTCLVAVRPEYCRKAHNDMSGDGFDTDTSSTLIKKVSRRGLLLGMAGIGAAVATGGGLALSRKNSEKSSSQSNAPAVESDESVSPSEAQERIDNFVLPDFYADRPWANPKKFSGMSAEELRSVSTVTIENDIPTAENLENIRRVLEAIANVGGTSEDMSAAREAGYPVGEKNEGGNPIGNYSKFIEELYVRNMVDGLFPDETEEGAEKITKYFGQYAAAYELALGDERWLDFATVFVDAELADSDFGSLSADLTIGRPLKDGGDWREGQRVHKGDMLVVVNRGANGESRLAMETFNIGSVKE